MCPCIIYLLRVPTAQRAVRVLQPCGSFSSPFRRSCFLLPVALAARREPKNCFSWQRWTERISPVSCASLGRLEGDTVGQPTSPSALAEEAYSGLEGQQ